MKKPVPISLAPTGIREACAVLLAATLASGAFAAPAPATSDPAVKKAAPGESPRLTIAHDPLKCLSTEARPLIDAKVLPTKELDQGFVYFRAAGTACAGALPSINWLTPLSPAWAMRRMI